MPPFDANTIIHYVDKLGVVGVLVLIVTGLSRRFRWWVPVWVHEELCQAWKDRYEAKAKECDQWRDMALKSLHLTRETAQVTEALVTGKTP